MRESIRIAFASQEIIENYFTTNTQLHKLQNTPPAWKDYRSVSNKEPQSRIKKKTLQ